MSLWEPFLIKPPQTECVIVNPSPQHLLTLFLLRFIYLFYLICTGCLPSCMSMTHVYAMPLEARWGYQFLWNWGIVSSYHVSDRNWARLLWKSIQSFQLQTHLSTPLLVLLLWQNIQPSWLRDRRLLLAHNSRVPSLMVGMHGIRNMRWLAASCL